jgi:hypothetical protein
MIDHGSTKLARGNIESPKSSRLYSITVGVQYGRVLYTYGTTSNECHPSREPGKAQKMRHDAQKNRPPQQLLY